MDKRAKDILFSTFWSSTGWKGNRHVAPEDLAYAKAAGVMFDPVSLSHEQVVQRAIKARNAVTPEAVADGFLASLSMRRVELRSALGSYAVLRFLPRHAYAPQERWCAICRTSEDNGEPHDFNVLSFERFKWGGVRHDQPLYALFDLEQFLKSDRPRPSATDLRIFRELIQKIRRVPPDTSAAQLHKNLSANGFKSNKPERDIVVAILGFCGILETVDHPGYFQRFIPYSERRLPLRRFVDIPYPACWWHGTDGINETALMFYFGHVL